MTTEAFLTCWLRLTEHKASGLWVRVPSDTGAIDGHCAVLESPLIVGYPPPERRAHRRAGGGAEGKRSDYSRERSGARPGGTGAHTVGKTGTFFLVLVPCMLKDDPDFQPVRSTSTFPTVFLKFNPCQSRILNLIFPYVWDMKNMT